MPKQNDITGNTEPTVPRRRGRPRKLKTGESGPSKPRASYFGGNWGSTAQTTARRYWYGSAPQDAREDMTTVDRLTMIQKCRYAEKNCPPAVQAANDLVTYVVGDGITPTSHARDPEKARAYNEYYRAACRRIDASNRFSDAQIQAIAVRSAFIDGEIFMVKVREANTNAPKIQLIEAHRCANPDPNKPTPGYVDGAKLGPQGQIIAWNFIQDDGSSKPIDATQVFQLANLQRSSGIHGIPALQHALNSMQDQLELFEIEKRAAKDSGDVSRVLTKTGGGIDDNLAADLNGNGGTTSGDVSGQMGGKLLVLEPGEDLKMVAPLRPSPAWVGFNSALERSIAQGQLPYEFTADASKLGGSSLRLIAGKSDRYMGQWQNLLIEQYCNPLWEWVIGDAIDKGELPEDPAWNDVSWTTPRSVSVDAGRDSANDREDLRMGLTSFTEIYKRRGMNYERDLEEKCKNMRFAHDMAAKYGLAVEEVVMIARNSFLNVVSAAEQPDAPSSPEQQPNPTN